MFPCQGVQVGRQSFGVWGLGFGARCVGFSSPWFGDGVKGLGV